MLTREIIKSIFVHNKMSGRIESGYRYWVSDVMTLSFYHKNYPHWEEFKTLLDKTQLPTSPIEKSSEELTARIEELVENLYNLQHD